MKPVFIFDLDGTLLDIREKFYALYVDCLRELGGQPISMTRYWELKQKKTRELDILKISGNETLFATYYQNRIKRIEAIEYLSRDSIWPGLTDELELLHDSHQMAIVTLRTNAANLAWQIDRLGLGRYFPHILSSGEGSSDSNRFEIKVDLVQSAFGLNDFNGWFFGDTEVDVLAGKALGMQTGAVTFGLRDLDFFKPLAPDKILTTPEEFRELLHSL